jgi:hypothetical protein
MNSLNTCKFIQKERPLFYAPYFYVSWNDTKFC